jgi:tetratricopeptide (TPR) repeat protein
MSGSHQEKKPESGPFEESTGLEESLARRLHAASGHPALPWAQIPEAERRACCLRARQTLAFIREAGYEILPAPGGAADPGAGGSAAEDDAGAAARCVSAAERYLHIGEPLLAYNTVQKGLESWPEDLRLRQLQGIALARSGDIVKANGVLATLRAEGHTDGETLGPLARTHKDLGLASDVSGEADEHLRAAFQIYEESYLESLAAGRVEDAYYTGINAATMAVFLDDAGKAREIAARVRDICAAEARKDLSPDAAYWVQATMGEAALILGDMKEAAALYRKAATLSDAHYGDMATTRRQAARLLEHLGLEGTWLNDTLVAPPVLVFSGHMIDRPDRPAPRFPPDSEPAIAETVHSRLAEVRPVAVYGSAACGADILCLEAARDLGAEIHITLPFPPTEFREFSVDFPATGNWGERFDSLLEAADSLTVTSENRASGSASTFHYANIVQTGLCRLRAELLGTTTVGLAVWDGQVGDDAGGTATAVDLWQRRGMGVIRIDAPVQARPDVAGAGGRWEAGERRDDHPGSGLKHELKAMLFADAVGYSRMTEDQIPLFIGHFLGAVANLNAQTDHPPIHTETAGDGLYVVFDTVTAAAHYALELSERIRATDWPSLGLPDGLDLRVGLHCGPIFCGRDPITGLPLYTGPHTSRTARIEPITPPGQVYASRAFAAVAAAAGVTDLKFTYVGRTDLAKKYGALGLFHVDRA